MVKRIDTEKKISHIHLKEVMVHDDVINSLFFGQINSLNISSKSLGVGFVSKMITL